MPLIATAGSHSNIRRAPRPSILGRIGDAAWIIVVVLAMPIGILLVGAPIALLIKLIINAAERLF